MTNRNHGARTYLDRLRSSRSWALLFALCVALAAPTFAAGCDGGGGGDAGARMDAGGDAGVVDGGSDAGGPVDASIDAFRPDAGPPRTRIDDLLDILTDPTATAGVFDGVLREVSYEEGWPVTDGRRWLFLTRWDDAPTGVSVVSDVNGWRPDAHPATAGPGGLHFWVLIRASELEAPVEGAKYKWYGDTDIFRAPPESLRYGYDEFGEFGLIAPSPTEPHFERFLDYRSRNLENPRTLRAYLPAGFAPLSVAAGQARVLLLHDGQNVFDPEAIWGGWGVDEALRAGGFDDVVALAIDNTPDRFDAYTHVSDIIDAARVGGRGDDYLALIRDEALPFLRARYGLSTEPASLMIAGSSLGGLITLYRAMTEPDSQACVAALSSTLGWGAYDRRATGMNTLFRLWETTSGHGNTSIYLDSGGNVTGTCGDVDGDGIHEDSDDFDNYCVTLQLRDELERIGYTFGTDLFHWWEPDATHNEAAWRARFPMALSACESGGWVRM